MGHKKSNLDFENQIDEPKFNSDEIGGIIPVDTRKPFDIRKIIARIVDGSRFNMHSFKF